MLARARGIWVAAAAMAVIHLVLATRYGFHRDELYLLEHGRHAFDGSLDHSIATPLVSWATQLLLGDSAVALRVAPALLGGGLVVTAASLCRRLGGDPWAQWLAAGVVASSPVFIYTAGVFGTAAIDQLVAAILTLGAVALAAPIASAPAILGASASLPAPTACPTSTAAASATSAPSPRWWLIMGAVAGLGIANKLTTLLVVGSLAVALAVTPARRWIRTPWPYLAILIAAAFTIPDLALGSSSWLDMFGQHHDARRRDVALADLGLGQLADIHPLGIVALACAVIRARRDPGARVAIASWTVAGVALLIAHGKHYQWAPWFVAVIAAGAVPMATWLRTQKRATRRVLVAITAASTIVSWGVTLPVLPANMRLDTLHRELVQFADWEGLVGQLAAHQDLAGLPRGTPIVTDSYGTAAAIEHYGPAWGLSPPISGANSYHLWTRVLPQRWELARVAPRVLWIGYTDELRAASCREVAAIGTLQLGDASNRYDFPRPVYRCELRRPLAEVWDQLRAFD